jgi:CSLREA domain-containing protein
MRQISFCFAVFLCAAGLPGLCSAETFTVDSTLDEVDAAPGNHLCSSTPSGRCTLRAAIQEHNAIGGANTIQLPAGLYALTRTGANESESATGSLDVNGGTLTILGAGAATTVIDAAHIDTAFAACPDVATSCSGRGRPTISVVGVTFTNGGGPTSVVGIRNNGTMTLNGCVVTQGLSVAIFNTTSLTVVASTIAANGQAGIGSFSGSVTVAASTIAGNVTGIGVSATALAVDSTTIRDNGALVTGGSGLAITGGSATVRNSTFRGNLGVTGAGIRISDATVTLTNTTVSGNHASDRGGGILVDAGSGVSNLTLDSATVTANVADGNLAIGSGGGGLYAHAEPQGTTLVHLRNTILSGNTDLTGLGPDYLCDGPVLTEHGHNLFSPGHPASCSLLGDPSGDVVANPQLGALADNGGPTGFVTATHRPLEGSPAIDAGNPATPGSGGDACPIADQRGVVRPRGVRCDIGAYETRGCAAGDGDGDGTCTAQDDCPSAFDPDQSDLDDDGAGDMCDPCPAAQVDDCLDAVATTIGAIGGTLATGNVSAVVPPAAVSSVRSFSITRLGESAFGIGSRLGTLVEIARLGPDETSFALPIALALRWPDTVPPLGVVDGSGIDEAKLELFRDGKKLGTCATDSMLLCTCTTDCAHSADCPASGLCNVKSCVDQGCPSPSASCCDPIANQWTILTKASGEIALGLECGALLHPVLTITNLAPPPGDDVLTFKGTFTRGDLPLAELSPLVNGLRLSIRSSSGAIDIELPAGAYDPGVKRGWKVLGHGRKWLYLDANPGTSPGGIYRALVQDKMTHGASLVSFIFKGRKADDRVTAPLEAQLVLPGPERCFVATYAAASGGRGCKTNPAGTRLTCN